MTRIDLPQAWAPIAHALICDARVSDAAVRLYALLHRLGWEHVELSGIAHLATLWPVAEGTKPPTERSVYRWLSQLESAGWISFSRKPGQKGLGDRLKIHPEPLTPESEPPMWNGKPLTPESEDRATSDTRVRASDTRVRGEGGLPRPNAAKNATQILDQILTRSDPPPPPEPASPGGGGGAESIPQHPAEDPETKRLLVAAGVRSPNALRRLGHLTPAIVRRFVAEAQASRNAGPGLLVSLLDAYLETGELPAAAPVQRVAPVATLLPEVPPLSAEERHRILARYGRAS